MPLKSAHLLCCASAFVVAAYETIRLTPQASRAAHLGHPVSSTGQAFERHEIEGLMEI